MVRSGIGRDEGEAASSAELFNGERNEKLPLLLERL